MERPADTQRRVGPSARATSAVPRRASTLADSVPTTSVASSSAATGTMKDTASTGSSRGGVQLLSPSLHRGLRATTTSSSSFPHSNQHDVKKSAVFDFDSFTLEAVRRRHETDKQLHAGSFLHSVSAASSSGGSPRSPSMARSRTGRGRMGSGSSGFAKAASCDRLPSLDSHETHSVRSMDDYEWGHRHTHMSSYSSTSGRMPLHSMSSVGTMSKRMSMASSTTSSALHGGHGVSRLRAEVVVRGWLQRRRGRVLKRWKTQYCVLKTDQRLCLYASEDTVNGRLEGRFQLLRATYNDKHGSFQVIGIGSDETPYKEEFKPLDDDGWRVWFLALREFFTPASIHEALERMPELSLLPGVHASLLEDDDDDDDANAADFAHEVEEMVLRPYGYGGSSSSGAMDERTSASNTSSWSTASSSNQHQNQHPHQHQRVHNYQSSAPLPASDRKTVLFDANDLARYTTTNQSDADVATELPEPPVTAVRASNYRKLYTGGTSTRSKASSIASSTGSSASTSAAVHHHNINMVAGPMPRVGSSSTNGTSDSAVPVDCPMIERDSQTLAMAILERCGSESVVSNATSRDSDSGYSWNRP